MSQESFKSPENESEFEAAASRCVRALIEFQAAQKPNIDSRNLYEGGMASLGGDDYKLYAGPQHKGVSIRIVDINFPGKHKDEEEDLDFFPGDKLFKVSEEKTPKGSNNTITILRQILIRGDVFVTAQKVVTLEDVNAFDEGADKLSKAESLDEKRKLVREFLDNPAIGQEISVVDFTVEDFDEIIRLIEEFRAQENEAS